MEDSMSSSNNEGLNLKKRDRDDSEEAECNSPAAKRIRDDLLDILDDSEVPETQDLDSVMKSFAEEIMTLASNDVTIASDSSQPDLGYLLEASDDELGLPPAKSESEEKKIAEDEKEVLFQSGSFETEGFGEIWGFEDEIPYEEFGGGIIGADDFKDNNIGNCNAEFLALDGLFDYSDVAYDYTWRQQQPAL